VVDVIYYGMNSPNVDFWVEYEWVQHSSPEANYSWVKARLRCANRSNATTGSQFNASGYHRVWNNTGQQWDHNANPFLPSGYGPGAQRWRDEFNYDVYHDANGNAQVQYGMEVRANNTTYFSGVSAVYNLPRIPLAPGQPGTPTASNITTSSVQLNWSNGSRGHADIDQVLLRRWDGASMSGGYENIVLGAGTTSYTKTGLSRGTTHTFGVYNHNGDGYGPVSGGRTITIAHTAPDKPPTPTFNSATSSSLNISITDPSYTGGGITSREVQYSLTNDFSSGVVSMTSGFGYTFTISSLARYTPYFIRHRVTSAIGTSVWSDTLSTSTLADLPSAPDLYNATDIASTTAYSSAPSVADNGGAPLNNIRWQIATTQNTGAAVTTLGRYGLPFFTGLSANTLYWYRLAVQNVQGWGAYGPWVSFTTKSNVPGPPATGPTISAIGNNGATATWTAPSTLNGATVTGYTVRISPTPDFGTGVLVYSQATLSKVFDGLQPGTQYFVQVWSNTNNGIGSYSNVVSFTTTGTAPGNKPIWVRVAGAWKFGVIWVKVGGVWKQGIPWVKVAGSWKKL
jgi:hypothetical protein